MIDVKISTIVYGSYGAEDMSTQNIINNNDYKELYAQYNWFSNAYPSLIQQASDDFFLPGFQYVLIGISKNINTLMDKDSYFVTKVRIDKMHDMFFRSSEAAIALILERTLGKANGKFNLNKLTDLEAKIITSFNDYMYNLISKFLTPPPPTIKRTNFDVIHLTFVLKDIEKETFGKLIVSLPEVLLTPDTIVSEKVKFTENDFLSSTVCVKLKIGTTRFKLVDLKNIDAGDIVVFDDSDTHKMILKFNDFEKEVKLNPNLGLVIPFDYNEGDENMAENTNLWDSIEVDMSATFDTVKITLGDLKRIEQGLVVDLTSIYDNKVTLSVEDKPIARGELVIVNDRYGVKIDEVIAGNAVEESFTEEPQETDTTDDFEETSFEEEQQTEEPVQNESNGEEEFDYSDFELEDEDI